MGAFVLNLGAAASYADTGTTSVSTAGTETTLAVKIRVSGQLLQNAANAFSTHRICAIGGATQGSARLTVSVNGNNGDVRLNLGVGDFDNTAHTAETAGFSVDTALYYDIYADYGSNAGFIGIAQGGVEVVTPATRGASTMGANASNGRVRVGAALWTTGDGATGRVDGIAIYSAKKTTTTDRYADPDGESTTGRLAYWAFPEGTGTTTEENGGGTSMSFSATSAPTWVAGGAWDGTVSGGTTYTLTADAGSFTITGTDAGLRRSRRIAADAASYAITGRDAALRRALRVAADSGSLAIAGQDATMLRGYRVTADGGIVSLAGQDATFRASRQMPADSGVFLVTGQDATLSTSGRRLAADAGSFTLTGQDAAFRYNRRLAAESGAFALSGLDATLTYVTGYRLSADPGAITLSGGDATLRPSRGIVAESGSVSLAGQDAALRRVLRLLADPGSYLLTGQDAGLRAARVLAAESGSLLIVGQDVALFWSGEEVELPGYLTVRSVRIVPALEAFPALRPALSGVPTIQPVLTASIALEPAG